MWLMRQAGRYMAEFRAYSDKYPFRMRSETPEIAIELSLQPWRAFKPDGGSLGGRVLLQHQEPAVVSSRSHFGAPSCITQRIHDPSVSHVIFASHRSLLRVCVERLAVGCIHSIQEYLSARRHCFFTNNSKTCTILIVLSQVSSSSVTS